MKKNYVLLLLTFTIVLSCSKENTKRDSIKYMLSMPGYSWSGTYLDENNNSVEVTNQTKAWEVNFTNKASKPRLLQIIFNTKAPLFSIVANMYVNGVQQKLYLYRLSDSIGSSTTIISDTLN